jgi:hypothetical protein
MEGEVAKLRKQIEAELQAMKQGLSGFAISARHDIVQHKYNSLGNFQEELAHIVGESEATLYMCERYIDIIG